MKLLKKLINLKKVRDDVDLVEKSVNVPSYYYGLQQNQRQTFNRNYQKAKLIPRAVFFKLFVDIF